MGLAPQARSLPAIHALLHNVGQGRNHERTLQPLMFVLSRLATPAQLQRLDI